MADAGNLDLLWVLLCTVLVALMQPGFLLLEAGAVRTRNMVSVALKNVADFCLSSLLFWLIGFGLMFGPSAAGLIGRGGPGAPDATPQTLTFLLFQTAFCGTAATIVSGAVAERMRFGGYLATTVLVAVLIYPPFGHWAWGGLGTGAPAGWLETLGFHDFAGSTVVHSVGGWVALAAILVLGPREGVFAGGERRPRADNLGLTAAGALLLWIGWFGFNGGSMLAFDASAPSILLNTLLAAAAGGGGGLAATVAFCRRLDPMAPINGALAGLVAVTASCDLASASEAAAIGAVGGAVARLAARGLSALRVDDAVGAVPVHLAAGAWGTLAVALVAEAPDFSARLDLLGVQALGVAAAGVWAFGLAWPALMLTTRLRPLRVAPEIERAGLDAGEFAAGGALTALVLEMEAQKASGDFSHEARVEPGSEAGLVAAQYNRVLDRVRDEIAGREALAKNLAVARDAAEAASRAKSEFLATMSHEIRTPMNAVLGVAALLDRSDLDAGQARLVREIRAAGETLVGMLSDILEIAEAGGARADAAPFSLHATADALRDEFAGASRAKGLAFNVDCAERPGERRLGDAERVARVARHLVANAIRFTETGSVAVSLEPDGPERAAIVVEDTGPGVPEAERRRIFEPFAQLDSSATRRVGGAGLGLAVVASLTRALGGEIALDAAPGGGARFTVRLPLPRVATATRAL